MKTPNFYYSYPRIQEILSSVTLLDYGFYLAAKARVRYRGRLGTHHYFEGEGMKMAIKGEVYYDFKKDKGGGLISAVIDLEGLGFLEAVRFLEQGFGLGRAELSGLRQIATQSRNSTPTKKSLQFLELGSVRHPGLLAYFKARGISSQVVKDYGLEARLKLKGRPLVAFALENAKGGYELRTEGLKLKSGLSCYSMVEQSAFSLVVFEGLMDLLSYVQWTQKQNRVVRRTLVALNSVVNTRRFMNDYADFSGYLHLCLDGDKSGGKATEQLLSAFKNAKVRDVRWVYGIQEGGYKDLNEALLGAVP